MQFELKLLGISLVLASALSTVAQAQYPGRTSDSPASSQARERSDRKSDAKIMIGGKTVKISAEFLGRYQALQAAVEANSGAVSTELAATQAAAKTPAERYLVAMLQLKIAHASQNEALVGEALEAVLASGAVPLEQLPSVYLNIGKVHYNQKRYDRAATAFEKVLELEADHAEATTLLTQSRQLMRSSGNPLIDTMQAIAQQKASGRKPAEELYKRAVGLAYEAKQPTAVQLAREWITAYPNVESWRNGLAIYRNIYRPDETVLLDVLRLARITGAMSGEGDYHRYGYLAVSGVTTGEAKAVIEEGIAAKQIDGSKPQIAEILAEATKRSAGQKERLAELAKAALAGSNLKAAVNAGDISYSYGEFERAAELYRAALGITGADKDKLNLRLGMALARAGDRAGATAAFQSVTGARSELAKFWLVWVNLQG